MHSAFGRPVVIWTGTNEYTHAQIAAVHKMFAGRAYLLAASKNVADYERIADVVDGEAYYWSSANPRTTRDRHEAARARLDGALRATASGSVLLRPASTGARSATPASSTAPTVRPSQTSLELARRSSPDAIGVISWNEWSENTYIEPGRSTGVANSTCCTRSRTPTAAPDTILRNPRRSAADQAGRGCAPVGFWRY